jgi:DNA modification methylase
MRIRKVTIGPATLYRADCLDVLPRLADVACIVTSPPYNQLGSRLPRRGTGMHANGAWVRNTRRTCYFDDRPEDEYQDWLRICAAAAAAAATRPGGSMFFNHKCRWLRGQLLHPLELVRLFGDWHLRQEIIWARSGSVQFNARMFATNDERIYWLVRPGAKWRWNQASVSNFTVWKITQDRTADRFPCPFPQEIPRRCIDATTCCGEIVCDPFMGSATTGLAAIAMGRRFIGIELDEEHFEHAVARMRAAWKEKQQGKAPSPRPSPKGRGRLTRVAA